MTDARRNTSQRNDAGALSHFWKLALGLAILAVAADLMILFGARLGFWSAPVGFGLYRTYFNPIAFIALGIGLAGLIIHLVRKERRGILLSGIAALLGVALLVPMISATINPPVRAAPIHDITTDMDSPPEFLVLDDTRPDASNSLDYAGQETADIQKSAYPDIEPILTEMPAADAFARSLSIARGMGWEIVAQDPAGLRFEATARTPVFHFADDVVLVVTALPDGSRVDIRSVSRVGRSDQGMNAARIRAFVAAFAG